MGSDNYFSWVANAVIKLLTDNADIFVSFGQNLFRGLAIILIAWFGIKSALSAASGGPGFALDRFAGLLMTIAFGYAMVFYYNNPIPGFGTSFYHLITDQGISLAKTVESATSEEVLKRIAEIYTHMYTPSGPEILDGPKVLWYFLILCALIAAQFAVLGVISFGFAAVGVCVLVGPIFIPFYIVPGLEWMFWGWFKSLLQYAFYQVIANAFVYVFGQLILNFTDVHMAELTGPEIVTLAVPFLFLLMAFIWGLLKVPSLTASIFSGRAGESAVPFVRSIEG